MRSDIDIAFDFRKDTPEGKDPDTYSKTLRRYHKQLWSKSLPSGEPFELDDRKPGSYLYHRSALGEFWLASDAVIPTFRWHPRIQSLIAPDVVSAFNALSYTIGGMMVFPGNQVERKWTLNQARGCTRAIGDRFDLTLECIRLHYAGGTSPLSGVLARYSTFFGLFQTFQGYVDFFLLQDLVTPDGTSVRIAPPFDGFRGSPIPATAEEYESYRSAAVAFVEARNRRISQSL